MRDPFPLSPIQTLVNWSRPWAERLGLPSLPLHVHEALAAALLYSIIFYPVSPLISNFFAGSYYSKLPRKKRVNWDAHVVSMVQSLLINALALYVMLFDEDRQQMDWEERVWGYTESAGLIQAMAAGYFLWDLIVTSLNFDVFGPGTLAHAAAALTVYAFGFRPFVNYYGCIFILWELSTPFLNVHWFLDKVNMTGSRVQLYNGFFLLGSFFSCRLVFGTYQSMRVFGDILRAVNRQPSIKARSSPFMLYTTDETTVPPWLAGVYLVSNLTLNGLNFYWFFLMVRAVRKRFVPGGSVAPKSTQGDPITEAQVDFSGVIAGVASGIRSEAPSSRRRKV